MNEIVDGVDEAVDYLWDVDEYDPNAAAKRLAYVVGYMDLAAASPAIYAQADVAIRVLVEFLEKEVFPNLPKNPDWSISRVIPSNELAKAVAERLLDLCNDNPRSDL